MDSIQKACSSEYVWKHIQSIPARPSRNLVFQNSHTYKHTLWGWGTNRISSLYLVCLGENKKEEPNYLWTLGQAQNQTLFHWGQNVGGGWESGIGISEDSASAGSRGLLEEKERGRQTQEDRHTEEMKEVMGNKLYELKPASQNNSGRFFFFFKICLYFHKNPNEFFKSDS